MNTCATNASELTALKIETPVQLPLGLLGFEQNKDFLLISKPEEAPFRWLQMQADSRLAFLVLSPFEVLPEYEVQLGDEDAEFLGLSSPDDALIYNIVTLKPDGRATVNLKGPIVFNRHSLIGKQVVLSDSPGYALNHPLP